MILNSYPGVVAYDLFRPHMLLNISVNTFLMKVTFYDVGSYTLLKHFNEICFENNNSLTLN